MSKSIPKAEGMEEVEEKTKAYADAYRVLETRVTRMTALLETVNRRLLPGIKSAVASVNEAKSNLYNFIDANRNLFEKPKTHVFHGIKVGLKKGTGAVDFESEEQVIKLIKSKLPEKVELLIETKEKVMKGPLAGLEVAELKKIGVTVENTGDQVLIKVTDSNVDKVVKALLKDTKEEAEGRKEAA